MKIKLLRLILPLVCITAFGCGQKTETNVEKGYKTKTLYIANGSEPEFLDPHTSTGSPENNIQLAMFEGLTMKDHKTLKPTPGVAKSWDISEDRTFYTFHLRDNAKWSNGDPVTAQDFVNSWQRILTPSISGDYAYMLFVIKNAEKFYRSEIADFSEVGIKAVDEHTLTVQLNNPTPYFLQLLDHHSFYPVNKKVIEQHGDFYDPLNPWTRPENIVSNGAFKMEVWDVNRAIELVRNEYYWGQDRIHLNRLVFYPIEDKLAEERAFRSGQIHLTFTPQMATEKIAVYREKNPEALHIQPAYSTYYYMFNTTKKPFDDARVRQALAYAVDRKTLVEKVTKGGEVPSYSLIPMDPEGYSPKTLFSDDIEKAKALLAEAGYPNGEGFPTVEILYNNDEVHKKVALTLQQMWKNALNINVQLFNQEWKVYLSSRKNKTYDIARAGWIADYLDPSNFLEIFFSFSENNHTGWENAEYDQILRDAQSATTDAARFELFERANQILFEEMPLLPLFYYSDVNLVNPTVKNWHDNVMHYHRVQDVDFTVPASE
ncbi:Periplasmic oligopeptide-binding protein [Thalassocella blandensis]|nr:Periplasmic oligopeptide-binding protein [Thalassocella blandensis]